MKPPIVMATRTRFVGGRNFPQPKQRLDENMWNYQPEITAVPAVMRYSG